MPLKVHPAHHPLHALCVVIDLGHVLPQDPAGYVLRRGRAAATQELHEHQGLLDVAHAHAPRDGVAQALVGGGGGLGLGWALSGDGAARVAVCSRPADAQS